MHFTKSCPPNIPQSQVRPSGSDPQSSQQIRKWHPKAEGSPHPSHSEKVRSSDNGPQPTLCKKMTVSTERNLGRTCRTGHPNHFTVSWTTVNPDTAGDLLEAKLHSEDTGSVCSFPARIPPEYLTPSPAPRGLVTEKSLERIERPQHWINALTPPSK